MSSNEKQESRVSPAYRLIHHYRERAAAAIGQYNDDLVKSKVNSQTQLDLATAALDYYNALYEYRDDDALQEPWEERGIMWLEEAAAETVPVQKSLPRSNGAKKTVKQPKLLTVPPDRIKRTILELNDVAQELGFSAETTKSTAQTEITEKMIEEVEEWRKANLE